MNLKLINFRLIFIRSKWPDWNENWRLEHFLQINAFTSFKLTYFWFQINKKGIYYLRDEKTTEIKKVMTFCDVLLTQWMTFIYIFLFQFTFAKEFAPNLVEKKENFSWKIFQTKQTSFSFFLFLHLHERSQRIELNWVLQKVQKIQKRNECSKRYESNWHYYTELFSVFQLCLNMISFSIPF